jgi:hypothetical protein
MPLCKQGVRGQVDGGFAHPPSAASWTRRFRPAGPNRFDALNICSQPNPDKRRLDRVVNGALAIDVGRSVLWCRRWPGWRRVASLAAPAVEVAVYSRGVPLLPSRADAVGYKMAGGGSGDGGANNQPTDPGGNDTVGNVLGNFWAVVVVAVAVVSS